MRRIALLLRLLAGLIICPAQAERFDLIHYNTNNSRLPHDICYRLMQDRTGCLWIGTEDGLVRFDGRDMNVYRQGFRSRYVIAASEAYGRFLIATWKGGVHRLRNDSIAPLDGHGTPDAYSFNSNNILQYRDLVLLFNFSQATAFRYDPARRSLMPATLLVRQPGAPDHALKAAGEAYAYAVISGRLIAYNPQELYFLDARVLRRAAAPGYRYLAQTPDGAIYGLRDNRIYRLNAQLQPVALYAHIADRRPLEQFFVLPSGNVILRFAEQQDRQPSFSALGRFLYLNTDTHECTDLAAALGIRVMFADILPDRNGGCFWISTDGDGLYQVFEPRYRRYDAFRNPYITALATDSGRLYIGTRNGIYLLDGSHPREIHQPFFVRSFFRDRRGQLFARSRYRYGDVWLGTHKARQGKDTAACILFPHYTLREFFNPLYVVYELRDRATGRLLTDPKTFLPLGLVSECCEDATGRLWFACDPGLYTWSSGQAAPSPFLPQLFGRTAVSHLLPDSSGGIWAATGQGLFYLRDGRAMMHYDASSGLSNDMVNALLPDSGRLWIGTQSGLNILDLRTGRIRTCKKHDGLAANDVTALCRYGLHIVAGGSKGITLIPADGAGSGNAQAQLIPERILVDGRRLPADSPVVAGYRQHIAFSYNVVSYLYPELVRFRYRLSEQDSWTETPNKSLVFTNLEPGSYTLQLQARTYNSGWGRPTAFRLTIQQPWWMSRFFYSGILLLIAACAFLALHARERRYRRKAALKQQFAALKLKALQTQLNPHFISNTLNAIQSLSLRQDDAATSDALTRFSRLTRLLLESSRSRFITLADELQITEHYLHLEQLRFPGRFTYRISIGADIDMHRELVPGVLLQPFIENSINHGIARLPAAACGLITVTISRREQMCCIELTDNGIGRQQAQQLRKERGGIFRSQSSGIIAEIAQAVNNLPGHFIDIQINDLPAPATGTCVLICCVIPFTELHDAAEDHPYRQ